MTMVWMSLAVSTEICVIAHRTLKTVTANVRSRGLVLAQRPVAEDTKVKAGAGTKRIGDGLIQGDEPVARVNL